MDPSRQPVQKLVSFLELLESDIDFLPTELDVKQGQPILM